MKYVPSTTGYTYQTRLGQDCRTQRHDAVLVMDCADHVMTRTELHQDSVPVGTSSVHVDVEPVEKLQTRNAVVSHGMIA